MEVKQPNSSCPCPNCLLERLKVRVEDKNTIISKLSEMLSVYVDKAKCPRDTARYEEILSEWRATK